MSTSIYWIGVELIKKRDITRKLWNSFWSICGRVVWDNLCSVGRFEGSIRGRTCELRSAVLESMCFEAIFSRCIPMNDFKLIFILIWHYSWKSKNLSARRCSTSAVIRHNSIISLIMKQRTFYGGRCVRRVRFSKFDTASRRWRAINDGCIGMRNVCNRRRRTNRRIRSWWWSAIIRNHDSCADFIANQINNQCEWYNGWLRLIDMH